MNNDDARFNFVKKQCLKINELIDDGYKVFTPCDGGMSFALVYTKFTIDETRSIIYQEFIHYTDTFFEYGDYKTIKDYWKPYFKQFKYAHPKDMKSIF